MGSMTRINAIPPVPTAKTVEEAWDLWREATVKGKKFMGLAELMCAESDKAVDERGQLKQEYRERVGAVHPGSAQLVADHRVNATKVMQDAKADAMFALRRSTMYSNLAAACFAEAATWMSYIHASSGAH